jgi:hypothetical protein
MQTFLPYSDIKESLRVLDNKRLGKQRVEAYQIISALTGRPKMNGKPYSGWLNHPCCILWKNHIPLLKYYYNECIKEWVKRGFNNTMKFEEINESVYFPSWWGNELFHDSHKSNLLRKDFEYYSKFGWNVDSNDPYVWYTMEGQMYSQQTGTKERTYL